CVMTPRARGWEVRGYRPAPHARGAGGAHGRGLAREPLGRWEHRPGACRRAARDPHRPRRRGRRPLNDLLDLLIRPADEVAPLLLGAHLTGRGVTVRLTEVEAYLGEADPGSHAFRGLTPRTRTMFGEPGHLYVYFSYGMHVCANVVCSPEGTASAVLLRAGEVVDGLELARERRPTAKSDADLARGP